MSAQPQDVEPNEEATKEPPAKTIALPLFEGYRVVDHTLNFGGNIKLADQDVIDSMKLGSEVAIIVRGRVVSRKHNGKDDGEGNRLGASSSSTVIVESIAAYDE